MLVARNTHTGALAIIVVAHFVTFFLSFSFSPSDQRIGIEINEALEQVHLCILLIGHFIADRPVGETPSVPIHIVQCPAFHVRMLSLSLYLFLSLLFLALVTKAEQAEIIHVVSLVMNVIEFVNSLLLADRSKVLLADNIGSGILLILAGSCRFASALPNLHLVLAALRPDVHPRGGSPRH
jgi:hypothetical protein